MKRLRVATLNCLNLALAGRRFYDNVEPYSADEYIAKTQWLANLLDRLAADLVLVQEVFHEAALSDVVRQSQGGTAQWHCAVPLAAERNDRPRLGLIWRAALVPRIDSIADFPAGCAVEIPEIGTHAKFSRPLLRARLALAGRTLTLINLHLKSRRPTYKDGEAQDDPLAESRAQLRALIQRGAEAAALRQIVVSETRRNHEPLIVAGDFNDEAGSVTTQIVADTSWKREDRPQRDCMLFNALDVERRPVPGRGRDVAFSILHGGEPERIDHVLVSEQLVPECRQAIGCVTRVEILNDHLSERARKGAEGTSRLDRIYSDHAAICVQIELD
jgi:endonuclease/exonuclease/phosphatase family metal-dependent hydrolase